MPTLPTFCWVHAMFFPQVNDFLAAGEAPAWFKQQQREAKRKAREESRRRRQRVVVVGAGPAGLTAALHLKAG